MLEEELVPEDPAIAYRCHQSCFPPTVKAMSLNTAPMCAHSWGGTETPSVNSMLLPESALPWDQWLSWLRVFALLNTSPVTQVATKAESPALSLSRCTVSFQGHLGRKLLCLASTSQA